MSYPLQNNDAKPLRTMTQIRHGVVVFLVVIAVFTLVADTGFLITYETSHFRHDFIEIGTDHVAVPRPGDAHKRRGQGANGARHKKPPTLEERKQQRLIAKEIEKQKQNFYKDELEERRVKEYQAELEAKQIERKRIEDEKKKHRRGSHSYVLDFLAEAGINTTALNQTVVHELPTYGVVEKITAAVHDPPVVYGLDTCESYRERVPAVERMLGPAGMFQTGTNLLNHLMKKNCRIPDRVDKYGENATAEDLGMRWQVPWGKHNPAGYKWTHITKRASKEYVNTQFMLPVITVRHPYSWMQSMCTMSFTVRWPHVDKCPHIMRRHPKDPNDPHHNWVYEWNPAHVSYADGDENYQSIAHLWTKWYKPYHKAHYPRLFVRYEDLLFYTKETVTKVCDCMGGEVRQPFTYIVGNSKGEAGNRVRQGEGTDPYEGIIKALLKNNKPLAPNGGWKKVHYEGALQAIDPILMEAFGYVHPKPRPREDPNYHKEEAEEKNKEEEKQQQQQQR